VVVMEFNYFDEVRVDIELPADMRRKLARRSVAMGTDLCSLIYQIILEDCSKEKHEF
jgi:hypothetical protein